MGILHKYYIRISILCLDCFVVIVDPLFLSHFCVNACRVRAGRELCFGSDPIILSLNSHFREDDDRKDHHSAHDIVD